MRECTPTRSLRHNLAKYQLASFSRNQQLTVEESLEYHQTNSGILYLYRDEDASEEASLTADIPDRELRLVDENGADVSPGDVGEIWATAPQVMLGYWNRDEDTAKTLDEGWLHTGDMGRVDEDGYLYVVDRVKDMIVTGGCNVYAREVEDVLLEAPGVARAAVVGLPHRIWGEEVTAVLVAADGSTTSDDAVKEHCRARLAGYKMPKRINWVDEIPLNSYGKVLKRQLRNELQESPA